MPAHRSSTIRNVCLYPVSSIDPAWGWTVGVNSGVVDQMPFSGPYAISVPLAWKFTPSRYRMNLVSTRFLRLSNLDSRYSPCRMREERVFRATRWPRYLKFFDRETSPRNRLLGRLQKRTRGPSNDTIQRLQDSPTLTTSLSSTGVRRESITVTPP